MDWDEGKEGRLEGGDILNDVTIDRNEVMKSMFDVCRVWPMFNDLYQIV